MKQESKGIQLYEAASIAAFDARWHVGTRSTHTGRSVRLCWELRRCFRRPITRAIRPPMAANPELTPRLAYLFPRDADSLNAMGTEVGQSRLWEGIHFRSDIHAGLALGRAVTQKVVERVASDGAEQ